MGDGLLSVLYHNITINVGLEVFRMKNYLLIVGAMIGFGSLTGCTTDDVVSASLGDICVDNYCPNGSSESCSGDSGGYYTYNGSNVCSPTYSSSTLTACAQETVSRCTGSSKSEESVKLLEANMKIAELEKSINEAYIDLGNEVKQ